LHCGLALQLRWSAAESQRRVQMSQPNLMLRPRRKSLTGNRRAADGASDPQQQIIRETE